MIDTLYPHNDANFLITRFLSSDLKKWAVLDGDEVIYKDIIKASYEDFKLQVLSVVPTPRPLAILHALRSNGYGTALNQYVIWQPLNCKFTAATLLQGNEDFKIKGLKK